MTTTYYVGQGVWVAVGLHHPDIVGGYALAIQVPQVDARRRPYTSVLLSCQVL